MKTKIKNIYTITIIILLSLFNISTQTRAEQVLTSDNSPEHTNIYNFCEMPKQDNYPPCNDFLLCYGDGCIHEFYISHQKYVDRYRNKKRYKIRQTKYKTHMAF